MPSAQRRGNTIALTLLAICASLPLVHAENSSDADADADADADERTIEGVFVYGLAPNAATQSGSRLGRRATRSLAPRLSGPGIHCRSTAYPPLPR
jgi:hypothetical protein